MKAIFPGQRGGNGEQVVSKTGIVVRHNVAETELNHEGYHRRMIKIISLKLYVCKYACMYMKM